METLGDIVFQEWVEEAYSRKHIDKRIREEIQSDKKMLSKHKHGIQLVQKYLLGTYYPSKQARVAQLSNVELESLVMDLFVGIAYVQIPELFTSVTAQLAARLKFDNKLDAIATVAELIAVLADTDAFDIMKESKYASLMVMSRLTLSDKLVGFINNSKTLPPLVCEPKELVHNYSSGYLTHNDSLILGTGNHHDGDICLGVLNTINKVALKLDKEFLCKVEEMPTFDLDEQDKINQWVNFKTDSYSFYKLLANKTLYFTHKVDKRGRIYAQGYYINPQGSAFKKAQLELYNEEIVEGMP